MSDVVERLLSGVSNCTRPEGCVCGGDLPAIRRGCGWFESDPIAAESAAEILSHRARWSRLCALVMTDHRGDGLPTQEVTPDEMVAAVERVFERNASLGDAVAAERERCAQIGYRVCAETRHVTLGRKVEEAIREGG